VVVVVVVEVVVVEVEVVVVEVVVVEVVVVEVEVVATGGNVDVVEVVVVKAVVVEVVVASGTVVSGSSAIVLVVVVAMSSSGTVVSGSSAIVLVVVVAVSGGVASTGTVPVVESTGLGTPTSVGISADTGNANVPTQTLVVCFDAHTHNTPDFLRVVPSRLHLTGFAFDFVLAIENQRLPTRVPAHTTFWRDKVAT